MGGPCAWSEQGTRGYAGDARSAWGRAEGRSLRCEAVAGEKASVGARVSESNQEKVMFDRRFISA